MPDDTETPSSGAVGDPSAQPDTGGATRGKFRDLAQTALQSVADRSIELMKQGRFDELDPKMQEVLINFDTLRAPPSGEPAEGVAPIPADLKRYADIGKQAVAAQNLAKIEGTLRSKVLQENWVSDARELFAEFGETEIDLKDWQAVDPTNRNKFPLSDAGYHSWKTAVNTFRRTLYSHSEPAGAESAGAVDADRQAAGGRGRTPQPRATATGQSTELAKAQASLEGKNVDEYRESLRARLP